MQFSLFEKGNWVHNDILDCFFLCVEIIGLKLSTAIKTALDKGWSVPIVFWVLGVVKFSSQAFADLTKLSTTNTPMCGMLAPDKNSYR